MTDENKSKTGPEPKVERNRFKYVHISVSPLAYKRFLEIPSGERSRRVSKFLERCKPKLLVREPGERLLEEDQKTEG